MRLALLAATLAAVISSDAGRAAERIAANDNRHPAGRLRNGVLTLELELRTGRFRPQADDGPEVILQAFGERGRPLQVPAPLLRVPAGTAVEVTVRNTLSDSTLVMHGLQGRPGGGDDTVQVAPGGSRTVRFAADAPGTYFYWGSTTGKAVTNRRWIDSQLAGALIVDPAGAPAPADDRIFVLGLAIDSLREVMTINGKSWPDTERLDYTQGDAVRWRVINATPSSHPMHLHGFYFHVASRGGWAADTIYPSADRRAVVTELMQPGGTMAVAWSPERAGNWVFHCHFAFHISDQLYLAPAPASGDHGSGAMAHSMAGLVLGIRVRPRAGPAAPASSPPADDAAARRLRLLVLHAPDGADSAHIMGYALQEGGLAVPGPALVLERGRPVRITVVNRLDQPTAVHWHGIELESYADGVPNLSGDGNRLFRPIAPGDSFTAEFTPPRAGTFMYHAHANELVQILGGLYGPLVVVEPGATLDTSVTRTVLIGALSRHDSAFGVVNGRTDPAPIELAAGRTYRFRLINIGDARTYLALRRPDSTVVPWRAVAKDGADLPPSQVTLTRERFLTGPGETGDFEVTVPEPGDLRLDVHSPFAPWRLEVPVRVQ